MSAANLEALVILGCRVAYGPDGRLLGALGRRVATGIVFAREQAVARIVVAGGRPWGHRIEADAMADGLTAEGLPGAIRERRSWSTRQNAENTALILGPCRIALVTCSWHMPRAAMLFRQYGFDVVPVDAVCPSASRVRRVWWWGRERIASMLG